MPDLVYGCFCIFYRDELNVFCFKEFRIRSGECRCVADDAHLEHGRGLSGEHSGKAEHEQERKKDVPAQGRLVPDELHVARMQDGEKSFHGKTSKATNRSTTDGHRWTRMKYKQERGLILESNQSLILHPC